jgi:hypothetical protein
MSSRNGRFRGSGRAAAAALIAGVLTAHAASPASHPATAETAAVRYPEKARLILELVQFIEWPTSVLTADDGAFVVGVLGDPVFAAEIGLVIASQKVHGRPVRIRNFRNLDEVDPCPILVISAHKARLLPTILEFLSATPGILTVGDAEGFVEGGGVLRLVERPDRIAFEINRDAARRAQLEISAQLLRLAQRLVPAAAPAEAP